MTHPTANIYGQVIFWILTIFSVSWFGWLMQRRLRVVWAGQPQARFDQLGRRLRYLLSWGFGQKKVVERRFRGAGFMHACIFWGFLIVAIDTITLLGGGFRPGFHLPGFGAGGIFSTFYTRLKDVFELLVLAAVIMAFIRRILVRPRRLTLSWSANLILFLIGLLMVTDLMLTGLENITGVLTTPTFSVKLTAPCFSGITAAQADFWYQVNWWLHLVVLLFFLPYLPLSKHFHVITALPAVFFRRLDHGALRFLDVEQAGRYGAARVEDFGWKDLLDIYTCTECGRCQSVCPAFASGKPLDPKQINISLRKHLDSHTSAIISGPGRKAEAAAVQKATRRREALAGEVVKDEVLWACTMCGACEETCPLSIEFIDRMAEMRRQLVLEESRFPEILQTVFRNLENQGNPWGLNPEMRNHWSKESNGMRAAERSGTFEYLFWVGCAGVYSEQGRKTTEAMLKIFDALKLDFAILGQEEVCTGDAARRLGNEYLFQTLARQNIANFERYGVRNIITQCAHCYNTLKHEYPQLGGNYNVLSHHEFILNQLEAGRLTLNSHFEGELTYHDSCFAGRHNGIFDAPRTLIELLGGHYTEAEHSRQNAVCCGAGGGRMWLEEPAGQRVSALRTAELTKSNPAVIATACPFCIAMLTDGLKDLGRTDVQCTDLAVLIAHNLRL